MVNPGTSALLPSSSSVQLVFPNHFENYGGESMLHVDNGESMWLVLD